MPSSLAESRRKLAKLLRLSARREYRAALRHGVAAAVEHRAVAFEREPRAVLDVGANRGQFALFARRRFPDAALHCFEPVPAALDTLRRVVGDDVRIHPVAVGARSGMAVLHVSASDDSSSLLPVGPRLQDAYPGTRPVERIEVPVARLDDLLDPTELLRPCLMKIDVQGFEDEVLHGAHGLLESVDDILVECSFVELYAGQPLADDIIGRLRAEGFRLRGIYSLLTDDAGACLQADLLFSRPDPEPAEQPSAQPVAAATSPDSTSPASQAS
jgi:FkbM family methyltransferase